MKHPQVNDIVWKTAPPFEGSWFRVLAVEHKDPKRDSIYTLAPHTGGSTHDPDPSTHVALPASELGQTYGWRGYERGVEPSEWETTTGIPGRPQEYDWPALLALPCPEPRRLKRGVDFLPEVSSFRQQLYTAARRIGVKVAVVLDPEDSDALVYQPYPPAGPKPELAQRRRGRAPSVPDEQWAAWVYDSYSEPVVLRHGDDYPQQTRSFIIMLRSKARSYTPPWKVNLIMAHDASAVAFRSWPDEPQYQPLPKPARPANASAPNPTGPPRP